GSRRNLLSAWSVASGTISARMTWGASQRPWTSLQTNSWASGTSRAFRSRERPLGAVVRPSEPDRSDGGMVRIRGYLLHGIDPDPDHTPSCAAPATGWGLRKP